MSNILVSACYEAKFMNIKISSHNSLLNVEICLIVLVFDLHNNFAGYFLPVIYLLLLYFRQTVRNANKKKCVSKTL